jgi:geranylgeranyl diphosphate synthase type I
MSRKKSRKQSENVLAKLREKSKNGLEYAKKTILSERIEHKELHEALQHYVSNWNDSTHPGLFAVACEAVGGDLEEAVQIQAAIAMIAAAFDVHDDIIDKSELKHGAPTVFSKFGEELALLLGNAFLVEGFTLLGRSLGESGQGKAKVFEIIKDSLYEFGNAHALELDLKKRTDAAPEEYLEIIKMKAASIEGDMRLGALVGGGTPEEVEALAGYGRILGTLAMLREEFIDVFDAEELNQRIRNEYLPVPVLYAMQTQGAREKIRNLLKKREIRSTDVDSLVDAVFESKSVGKLKESMQGLIDQAIYLTSLVKNAKLKTQLQIFASSTLEDL